jgi:pimeloyl-ACP methyl ester carboxylesterase
MAQFTSDGLTLAYDEFGPSDAAKAMVLVHGFSSNRYENWKRMGWYDAIAGKGLRGFALDCRGHGESAKPHDPAAYSGSKMGDDVIALMDHRGIAKADLIGYSMGSFISSSLLVRCPERFHSVILAGVGDGLLTRMFERGERAQEIARAMEAPDAATSSQNETARNFRLFAQATGNDLQALAAMQRAPRETFDPARLRTSLSPCSSLSGSGTRSWVQAKSSPPRSRVRATLSFPATI